MKKIILRISLGSCFLFCGSLIVAGIVGIPYTRSASSPSITPPNFKVAFVGDQGVTKDTELVLKLIKNEGAQALFVQGDLGYSEGDSKTPKLWDGQHTKILGADFPIFITVGNHDIDQWNDYKKLTQERLNQAPGVSCEGNLGIQSACHYKGLFYVSVAPNVTGNNHATYMRDQLANDKSVWSICSWHIPGGAKDISEECRLGGGFIANGHTHLYSRSHLINNFDKESVENKSNTLQIDKGKTFIFLSGLGGKSMHSQGDPGKGSMWASVYSSSQNAEFGALFCTFHVDNQPNKARCYFKDVAGKIVDQFELISNTEDSITTPPNTTSTPPTPTSTPSTSTVQSIQIANGTDDAEENISSGSVSIISYDLELIKDTTDQVIGMRFQNINIPQGATIASATIQFVADNTNENSPTDLTFSGQAIDSAPTFTKLNKDISQRIKTVASVTWNNVPAWNTPGEANPNQKTPNLAPIIQEIVNRPGWVSGNSIVIIVTGSGKRSAVSYDGSPQNAPILEIMKEVVVPPNQPPIANAGPDQTITDMNNNGSEPVPLDGTLSSDPDGTILSYTWENGTTTIASTATTTIPLLVGSHTITLTITDNAGVASIDTALITIIASSTATSTPPTPTSTPATSTQSIRIASETDDAEENISSGSVNFRSSDLELIKDSGSNQIVGMRFQNVNIPQGTIVTNAHVQFVVEGKSTTPTSYTFIGEASDNAPTFVASKNNIAKRTKTTASVTWDNVPAWNMPGETGENQKTPNLAPIIQEIVNQPSWVSGNSIVIIVTGSGKRSAISYDKSPEQASSLKLEW